MPLTREFTRPVVTRARGNDPFRKGLRTGAQTRSALMAIPESGAIGGGDRTGGCASSQAPADADG